jgi:hypothetical protein
VIANIVVFLGIAVFGGLASSWYMVERGTSLVMREAGPWTTWLAAGRPDADPYTRAHFVRRGVLTQSAAVALVYEARRDSSGAHLHSACEYVVAGEPPPAGFWSIAVYNEEGRLIPNPAGRHGYSSTTAMLPAGGEVEIVLARGARPGNWLPIGGAGRIALVLTIEEPRGGAEDLTSWTPPVIRKVACR